MSHITAAAVLALAIGAVSFITSTAKISKAPRMWLAGKSLRQPWAWLFDLVSCPFCTATWLGLAAAAVYRPWLVDLWRPLDYLVTSLAITSASMLAVLVIKKAVT